MQRFFAAALDLFYPPHCAYCDRIVDSSAHPICKKCEGSDDWIADDEMFVKGKYFSACASSAWYRDEMREAFLGFKFYGRTERAKAFGTALARTIALRFPDGYDLLTWLPVSAERRQERGYDQSFLLADAASALLEVPLVETLEKAHTKAQSSLDGAAARRKNVQDAFAVRNPSLVQGKTVLLIDDLITTGSTMDSACKALLAAGATKVLCATFARSAPGQADEG